MTPRTRDYLKKRFNRNAIPTEEDFGDLIDSMLNLQDEKIDKDLNGSIVFASPLRAESHAVFSEGIKIQDWDINVSARQSGKEKLVIRYRSKALFALTVHKNSLDPTAKDEIMELFMALAQEGTLVKDKERVTFLGDAQYKNLKVDYIAP